MPEFTQPEQQLPRRWEVGLLLCTSCLVRLTFLFLQSEQVQADPDGYRRMAENVYHQGVLSDQRTPMPANNSQMQEPTSPEKLVPTAYRPPLHPLLLTAALASPLGFEITVLALHLVLGLLTVWLTVKLGTLLGLGRSSLLAGGVVALDPLLLHQSTLIMTETLAAFFTVLVLWLLVRWSGMHGNLPKVVEAPSTRALLVNTGLIGITLSLAALCRPTFLVFLLATGILIPFLLPKTLNRPAALAAFLLSALVVLAPWIIRNTVIFGRPIVATTHGGYTFHLANNPGFYEYLRSGSWDKVWTSNEPFTLYPGSFVRTSMTDYPTERLNDPALDSSAIKNLSPAETELLLDRLHYADAWQAIRAEPGMFAWSILVRLGRFWQPVPHPVSLQLATASQLPSNKEVTPTSQEPFTAKAVRYLIGCWYWGVYLLALAGCWHLGRTLFQPPWAWAILLLACFLALHAFYWTDMRMRAPVMPVLASIAAAGASGFSVLAGWLKSPQVNHLRKPNEA